MIHILAIELSFIYQKAKILKSWRVTVICYDALVMKKIFETEKFSKHTSMILVWYSESDHWQSSETLPAKLSL